jgi:hypothetical protein
MALYQFGPDEHVESSMQALLELAGDDPSVVSYRPGVGPSGAVELPDDLHQQWTEVKAQHDADTAKKAKADKAAASTDEEDTETEGDDTAGKTATRTSRRGAGKSQE